MIKYTRTLFALVMAVLSMGCTSVCKANDTKVYRASDFGIVPGTGEDMTAEVAAAIEFIKTECDGNPATLLFDGGEYDFFPDSANVREYYVSNHDQDNRNCKIHNKKHTSLLE